MTEMISRKNLILYSVTLHRNHFLNYLFCHFLLMKRHFHQFFPLIKTFPLTLPLFPALGKTFPPPLFPAKPFPPPTVASLGPTGPQTLESPLSLSPSDSLESLSPSDSSQESWGAKRLWSLRK